MRGDYGDQMGIRLDNCEYNCPYCKAPGSKSSLIHEQMGVRDIDVAELKVTSHKVLCMVCANVYIASKKINGQITFSDGVESGLMKTGYKSLKQQWDEAEQAKKVAAQKEREAEQRKEEEARLQAQIDFEAQAKAKAEVEFEAKVEVVLTKLLSKKKGFRW